MDNAQAEFDAHDMELIAQAQRETEAAEAAAAAQAQTEQVKPAEAPAQAPAAAPAAAPAQAPAAAPAAPAQAPAEAPAQAPPAPAAAPSPAAADAQGNTKAALRASRHEAKRLREENEALRKRLEESGLDTADKSSERPDESQLNDVREYAPAVGKLLERLEAENAELRKRLPAAEAPAPAFEPEWMPEDVQAGIDEVPELLLWQTSAEHHDKWQAVKGVDGMLARAPAWVGKPLAERFAHAVALVNAQFAAPSKAAPTPKTLEDAQRAIAAAPNAAPGALTVGDLRGGATPDSSSIPDYHKMKANGMSDEDLIASLP